MGDAWSKLEGSRWKTSHCLSYFKTRSKRKYAFLFRAEQFAKPLLWNSQKRSQRNWTKKTHCSQEKAKTLQASTQRFCLPSFLCKGQAFCPCSVQLLGLGRRHKITEDASKVSVVLKWVFWSRGKRRTQACWNRMWGHHRQCPILWHLDPACMLQEQSQNERMKLLEDLLSSFLFYSCKFLHRIWKLFIPLHFGDLCW